MTRVVILKVKVASGREREFERFVEDRGRLHQVRPGFERFYLLRGEEPHEYRVVSWWSRLEDPEAWVRQETYALSEDATHKGIVVGPVPHEVLEVALRL